MDALTRRLTLSALTLSSIPLVGGLAWGWRGLTGGNRIERRGADVAQKLVAGNAAHSWRSRSAPRALSPRNWQTG
jgi:hypothetical protein